MRKSPISDLNDNVEDSWSRLVPEKLDILISKGCSPYIVFTDDLGFSFKVTPNDRKISIAVGAQEYLWCACYTFYLVYQKYGHAQQKGQSVLDLLGDDELREAMVLYKWGYIQLKSPTFWPNDCPMPTINPSNEHVKVANELYLCAMGWILHHEIAHIYKNHKSTDDDVKSRQQEDEADKSAAEFILAGIADNATINKRCLGGAIAFLVMTSKDLLSEEAAIFQENTHPKSFVRLKEVLDKYCIDKDHVAYGLCTVMIHSHMGMRGKQTTINHENKSWKEDFMDCCKTFEAM